MTLKVTDLEYTKFLYKSVRNFLFIRRQSSKKEEINFNMTMPDGNDLHY